MNVARILTLLVLAIVVAAFAASWLTLPTANDERGSLPGRWFVAEMHFPETKVTQPVPVDPSDPRCALYDPNLPGVPVGCPTTERTVRTEPARDEAKIAESKTRVAIVYGSAAAVVLLIGLAFGAARRARES